MQISSLEGHRRDFNHDGKLDVADFRGAALTCSTATHACRLCAAVADNLTGTLTSLFSFLGADGSMEEMKLVLNLVRPRYFMPIHGEFHQLSKHARQHESAIACLRARHRPESMHTRPTVTLPWTRWWKRW